MHDLWNQTSHTSQHMACCPKSTLGWQQPHGKTDLYDGLGPGLICISTHKRSARKPEEVKGHDPEFSILQREKHLFCKRTCEHSARLGVFWIMSIASQVIAWVGDKAWLWSHQGTTVRAVNLASSLRVRRNVCVFMAMWWLLAAALRAKLGTRRRDGDLCRQDDTDSTREHWPDSSRTDTDSRAPQAKTRLPVGSGAILEIGHTRSKDEFMMVKSKKVGLHNIREQFSNHECIKNNVVNLQVTENLLSVANLPNCGSLLKLHLARCACALWDHSLPSLTSTTCFQYGVVHIFCLVHPGWSCDPLGAATDIWNNPPQFPVSYTTILV